MELLQLPSILECCHFQEKADPTSKDYIRQVMDYELDFNVSGGRIMYLDGKAYPIASNSVVCRVPGQVVCGEGDYNMYLLTMDYSGTAPIIARPRHQFNRLPSPRVESAFWNLLPTCFVPRHAQDIYALYRKLAVTPSEGLLAELFCLLAADALALKNGSMQEPTVVDQVLRFLNDNFARHITLDELADHVHQNKSYLVRCFHRETGLTPIACLNGIRLSHAQTLLRYSDESIASIAFQCGWEDASYFALCFRQRFGLSPTAYRRQSG